MAALAVEQVGEQAARAPVLDALLGIILGEPDVKVAELIENRCAVNECAAMDRIHVTSRDLRCCCARRGVYGFAVVRYARLAHQSTQIDFGRPEYGELKVQ